MASPGFGFSVGDMIIAMKLAIDVVKACKESGGAKSQYERALVEFQAYLNLLNRLQDQNMLTTADIGKLVRNCEDPIQEFMTKLAKYRDRLSEIPRSDHFGRHVLQSIRALPRQAQWALFAEKEVEKLRIGLGPSLSAIGLLLALDQGWFILRLNADNSDV